MGNKLSRSKPKATGPITASAARPTAVPRQPAAANTTTNPLDGVDPHLKRNLEVLGQVKINKQSTNYRPTDQMLGILAQRSQQEAAMEMKSPASGHNKLTAGQLANLLDSRKEAKSDAEVKELAKLYGVDFEVVENLGRFVTSPSVESKSVMGPEGEAVLTARWVDRPSTTSAGP